MFPRLRTLLIGWLLLLISLVAAGAGGFAQELKPGIDAVIVKAYQAAMAKFPCKIKTRGKLHMLRWEETDRCVNDAASLVDWAAVSRQLEALRPRDSSEAEFAAAVEESLSAHALTYDSVFEVKDSRALLPLTNSILKYLPPKSLTDLRVFDKTGTEVGKFAGVYSYERSGGLAGANTYRLTLFQYTDQSGNIQTTPDKLLLDSFGIPWEEARSQPGFRLTSDSLTFSRYRP